MQVLIEFLKSTLSLSENQVTLLIITMLSLTVQTIGISLLRPNIVQFHKCIILFIASFTYNILYYKFFLM
jgi:hypothetical protein